MQKIIVNLEKAKRNFEIIKSATPKKIICVVKSDAYGHGAEKLSLLYQNLGAHAFAVCDLQEAISLRNYGVKKDILVAGYTSPSDVKEIAKYRLTQSLISYDFAKAINRECERLGIRINAHIKIDTGMHRFGIPFAEADKIAEVFNMKNLAVTGFYTHFARADEMPKTPLAATPLEDFTKTAAYTADYTLKQYNAFLKAVKPYKGVFTHTSNSSALANYPALNEDGVRVGLSLYGFGNLQGLTPILEYHTKIVHIESVKAGDEIGYGGTYVCPKDGVIAVIPIGYANGFCPSAEDGGYSVRVKGRHAKVVGRVCMNHTFIDFTEIEKTTFKSVNSSEMANPSNTLKNAEEVKIEVGDIVTIVESQTDFLNLAKSQNFSVYRTLIALGNGNDKVYR